MNSRRPTLSFSTDDFAKALEQHDYQFQRGQVVRGKVASYSSDGIYVDVGGKAAAFLPVDEVSLQRVSDIEKALPIGDDREFLIIREQDADGQVTLSLRQLEIKQAWQRLGELQESNQTVQARISGVNKGGVTADVQGIRGFIPRSHLVDREGLDALIGKALTVSLIEVDPSRRRLVLSQRLATQAASLGQLEIGQLVEGRIVGIKPFGIFVDFDGTTGLLHINQISKNYVSSLESVFQVGQPIKALIIDIDESKRRVSLSTKVLENFPGEMLEKMTDVMADAADRAEKARQNLASRGAE
jgi:small subunit ribosomal protein S1